MQSGRGETYRRELGRNKRKMKHFILVHGACHGAWTWYKVATLLRDAGHRVTTVDLAASGINPKKLDDEVVTFADYTQPLLDIMASLPPKEKVILVGHSLGGLNLSLTMDQFPEKVLVAVFLAAFMPDTRNRPSYVLDKYFERMPQGHLLDTLFDSNRGPKKPTTMLFGPKCLSQKLYQLSPPEDLTLAMTLIRVGSLFVEDLSNAEIFSKERYGSVPRVYIICSEDKAIPQDYQRWMIGNDQVSEVKEISGSDHMPMFSQPQELCDCLQEIANSYA